MRFTEILNSRPLSEFVLDCGFQSILITGLILLALKLSKIRSIPLKNLVLVASLISLLCLPAISLVLRKTNFQWSQISIPSLFLAETANENPAPSSYPDTATDPVEVGAVSFFNFEQIDDPAVFTVNCLALLWACGLITALLRLMFVHFKMRHLKRQLIPIKEARVIKIWEKITNGSPEGKKMELLSLPVNCSPFSFGFRSPKIVIPSTLIAQWTDAEIRSALIHEKAHLDQHDTLLGLAQQFYKAWYWWNPMARWISTQLSLARELLCDFAVVEHLGNRKAYAATLVDLSENINFMQPLPSTSHAMARSLSSLEIRIKSLNKKSKIMNTPITKKQKFVTCMAISVVAIAVIGVRTSFALDVSEDTIMEIRSMIKEHPEIRREILEGDAATREMEQKILALQQELARLRELSNALEDFPELRLELAKRVEAQAQERRQRELRDAQPARERRELRDHVTDDDRQLTEDQRRELETSNAERERLQKLEDRPDRRLSEDQSRELELRNARLERERRESEPDRDR